SARELGVEAKRLSEEAVAFIARFAFPGNVRQLENLCHWLTVMAPAQGVKVEDLPLELRQESPAPAEPATAGTVLVAGHAPLAPSEAAGDWIGPLVLDVARRLAAGEPELMEALTRQFEAAVLTTALKHTHGRRIEAATKLGIGRNTITRKAQELGLEG
ncbi:MAG: helix-turn-helix domain-containing protein, partial [Burkholderiaceae bacterium]